jgi:hypothetical protein
MNNLLLIFGLIFVLYISSQTNFFSYGLSNRTTVEIKDYTSKIKNLEKEIETLKNNCTCESLKCDDQGKLIEGGKFGQQVANAFTPWLL